MGANSTRFVSFLGFAYCIAGRYADAIATLMQRYQNYVRRGAFPLACLAAAYAATGRDGKARAAIKALLEKRPKIKISTFPRLSIYKRTQDRDRLAKLLPRLVCRNNVP